MGLHRLASHGYPPPPWCCLFVSAALVAAANAAILPRAYELVNSDDFGLFITAFVIGLQFGQLLAVAVWAAWGPSNWLNNYALAAGSLLAMLVVSSFGGMGTDDELPTVILFVQSIVAFVLLPVLLLIFHSFRYLGRWRWQLSTGAAATNHKQFSLRGILFTTALIACALAFLKQSTLIDEFDFSAQAVADVAVFGGMFSLIIGTTMLAPVWLFIAFIDFPRRELWLVVAVSVGYILPLIVMLYLAEGELRVIDTIANPLLPVQGGVIVAASLAWAMQHAAGMRFVQRPPTMICS
jgi:hypothetical protein